MRYVGLALGGLFLADGLMALIGKRDLVKAVNGSVGKRLPHKVNHVMHKASDVNDTAMAAMGINNVIAGAGMVAVSLLTGRRK